MGIESTKVSHKSLIKFRVKNFYIGQENSFYYKNFFKKTSPYTKKKAYKYSKKALNQISKNILVEKSKSREIKKILIYCYKQ